MQQEEKEALIRSAIQNRRYIEFRYKGSEGLTRVVEPYCLGINHLNNHVLRGFQTEGYSFRGCPNWKMYCIKDIIGLGVINNKTFTRIRQGYRKGDTEIVNIILEVDYYK